MNYIKLINWFWQKVPYMDGFKTSHVALFFAIVDSINRNEWNPADIAYDYLINKCKLGKKSYLESREWLIDNRIIEMIPGKNTYQMARFNLSTEVLKRTAIDTATDTAIDTATDTAIDTAIDTSTAPNIKHINEETGKHTNEKEIVLPFASEIFQASWQKWKDYRQFEFKKNYKSIQSEQEAMSHLETISGKNESQALQIIQRSIANQWQGLFEIKKEKNGNSYSKQNGNGQTGRQINFD